MKLVSLDIENCRNIAQVSLLPDDGLTVIAGDNGQGKTNLLECIFLLTGSKSFRGAKDMDIVKQEEAFGRVDGSTLADSRTSNIDIFIEGREGSRRGRYAKVNGVDYGRAASIAGIFTAVVFEPNHLSLVKAGPEGRRRFLDAALCQLYPGYVAILRRFTRALSQKNALLRQYYQMRDADGQLDAFDAEIAHSGGQITQRRSEWLQKAGPAAQRFYSELSKGAEPLAIVFAQSAAPGELGSVLRASRAADIKTGYSTTGPHREDFDVLLFGQSARTFGSQGQQRSCVLALKLAEAEVAKEITGQYPVLLLDDVLSELDEGRQAYLLSKMGGRQSFVTTCEPKVFQNTAGKVVRMQSGELQEG